MWCLRYWAVVPLLPFPTAPPLFQLLWLMSMLASSRPCAYCSALLICLFLATCSFNQSMDDLTTSCRCFFTMNGGRLFSSLPSPTTSAAAIKPSLAAASSRAANVSVAAATNSTGTKGVKLLERWLRNPPSFDLPLGGEGGLRISLGL